MLFVISIFSKRYIVFRKEIKKWNTSPIFNCTKTTSEFFICLRNDQWLNEKTPFSFSCSKTAKDEITRFIFLKYKWKIFSTLVASNLARTSRTISSFKKLSMTWQSEVSRLLFNCFSVTRTKYLVFYLINIYEKMICLFSIPKKLSKRTNIISHLKFISEQTRYLAYFQLFPNYKIRKKNWMRKRDTSIFFSSP